MACTNDKDDISVAIQGCCAFASDLHKVMTPRLPEGNVVYSPLSLHVMLSYLYQGSEGDTAKEIVECLHLTDPERLDSAYTNLIIELNRDTAEYTDDDIVKFHKESRKPHINIANALFLLETDSVDRQFESKGMDVYCIAFKRMNCKCVNDVTMFINTWMSTNTNNTIGNIIVEEDIRRSAQIVLVSSIYFTDQWNGHFHFNIGRTESGVFHVSEDLRKKVPMMSQTRDFSCGEIPSLNSTFIQIPYKGHFDMIVIRPNETEGLRYVDENLDWNDVINAKRSILRTNLRLPRFKIVKQHDLITVFNQMGIKSMFNYGGCNRMIDNNCAKHQIFKINKFIQKVALDVAESGTEYERENYPSQNKYPLRKDDEIGITNFSVDRPFIAAIRHVPTNVPLLIASVRDIGECE